ncbi:MAG: hypothetical protein P0S95_07515 [Rhabdochlamydiaceae bacterium]|nr:hypothetical protein [Candidatus Amphrikana amoebophyrae]
MKLQVKLFIFFVVLSVIAIAIVDTAYYFESKKIMILEGEDRLMSLANTCAKTINFKGIDEIDSTSDDKSPIYDRIQNSLAQIKAANELQGLRITYAYTLKPSKKKGYLEFIVDGDGSKNRINVGVLSSDQEQGELIQNLKHPYVPAHFFSSERGEVMSAYAPIINNEGHYVATLGLDAFKGEVLGAMSVVKKELLFSSIAALAIAMILGAIISKLLLKPVAQLVTTALPTSHLYRLEHIKSGKHHKINNLARSITNINLDERSRKLLQGNFAQVLCSHFFDKLEYRGEEVESTILYIDLIQLSQCNKELNQQQYHDLLRNFFEEFIEIVSTYGGVLNKISRDKAWVVFGISQFPLPQEEGALQCAKEIIEHMNQLNQSLLVGNKVKLGFSISKGNIIRAKNSSTECRVPYPLIQVASEIAQQALHVKSAILVSGPVAKSLKGEAQFTKSDKKWGEDPLFEPA